jgi:hypothetical protein
LEEELFIFTATLRLLRNPWHFLKRIDKLNNAVLGLYSEWQLAEWACGLHALGGFLSSTAHFTYCICFLFFLFFLGLLAQPYINFLRTLIRGS